MLDLLSLFWQILHIIIYVKVLFYVSHVLELVLLIEDVVCSFLTVIALFLA